MQKQFLTSDFPRAILHIDGDGFFAGCEVAKDPSLKGKPVAVGRERGMVIAATYAAKDRGVKRGMTEREARVLCPDLIFLPADHETYGLFAERMYRIVERYSGKVERYSIDECFADLTGQRGAHHKSYPLLMSEIKRVLQGELGMTFSFGLAPTKVLAKVASRHNKPDGLTLLPGKDIRCYLEKLSTENVWGIGRQTSAFLAQHNINTALEFADTPEHWVTNNCAKPYHEIWQELRGVNVMPLHIEKKETHRSMMRTRTFTPPHGNKKLLLAALSEHIEALCSRARTCKLAAREISFFLKTQEFKYHGMHLRLSRATNTPEELIALVEREFTQVYRPNTPYRATGVTLSNLNDAQAAQLDLFDTTLLIERREKVWKVVDDINAEYGEIAVHLAQSMNPAKDMLKGQRPAESDLDRLGIPMMGGVS